MAVEVMRKLAGISQDISRSSRADLRARFTKHALGAMMLLRSLGSTPNGGKPLGTVNYSLNDVPLGRFSDMKPILTGTMHNPDTQPVTHTSKEEYISNPSSTVNHFHEKLFLLADRMNTKEAKDIAQSRHKFTRDYILRFHKEWNGVA